MPPVAKTHDGPWWIPQLAVKDVGDAVAFYTRALGFTVKTVLTATDGKPYHAELSYQGAVFMIGPETADLKRPATLGAASTNHYLYVERVDSAYERALDEGARPMRSPRNEFWGDRCCQVADPDGHTWMLATHLPGHDAWDEARKEIRETKKLDEAD